MLLLRRRRRRPRRARHRRGRRGGRAHPRWQREAPLELGALGAVHLPRLVRVALQAQVLLHVLGAAVPRLRVLPWLPVIRLATPSPTATATFEQKLRVIRAPGGCGEEGQPVRPLKLAVGHLPVRHLLVLVLVFVHVGRLAMVQWQEVVHVALVLLVAAATRVKWHRRPRGQVVRGRSWQEQWRRAGVGELWLARPVEELRRRTRRRRLFEREGRRRRGARGGGEELGQEEARLVAQRLEHVSHPQHEVQVLGYLCMHSESRSFSFLGGFLGSRSIVLGS